MANILFTTVCNRRCPYCFAQERIRTQKGDIEETQYLSFPNLVKIADFFERSNAPKLNILGGEPTIHPDFFLFIKYLLGRGFRLTVFSNGLIKKELLLKIREMTKEDHISFNQLRFCINVNEDHISSENEKQRQNQTFEILSEFCLISFNIHQVDFDLDFLIDRIKQYDLIREIRLGLAAPIVNRDNVLLPPESFKQVAEKITEMSDHCFANKITINFDCGFTLCSFTDEQLGKLFRNRIAMRFICQPCVDIGPDLKVWHCFPLSETYQCSLDDFDNHQELYKHLQQHYSEYQNKGIFPQCETCEWLQRDACSGGCISHYYNVAV